MENNKLLDYLIKAAIGEDLFNIYNWIYNGAEMQSGLKLISDINPEVFIKNENFIKREFGKKFGYEGLTKYFTMSQYISTYKRLNSKTNNNNELSDSSAEICMWYLKNGVIQDKSIRLFLQNYASHINCNDSKDYTKFLDIALAKIPQELRNSIPQLVKEYKRYVFEKDPNLSERNNEAIYIKIDWDVIKNAFNKKYNKNLDIATLKICYYNYLVGGKGSKHIGVEEIARIFKDQNEYLFDNIAANNGRMTSYSPNIENYNIVVDGLLEKFNQSQQQQQQQQQIQEAAQNQDWTDEQQIRNYLIPILHLENSHEISEQSEQSLQQRAEQYRHLLQQIQVQQNHDEAQQARQTTHQQRLASEKQRRQKNGAQTKRQISK